MQFLDCLAALHGPPFGSLDAILRHAVSCLACQTRELCCAQAYAAHFKLPNGMPFTSSGGVKPGPGAPHLLPSSEFIEELRPKSPPPGGRRG